jgi:hypothetical protein
MADLLYEVQANVTPAERNLAKLQQTVGSVNDTFIRLKSTLATISLGAIISQTIGMADAVSDLSDATEISIENILGFSRAVALNGGTVEGAQKGIAKLVASIDEAAEKFGSGREAFNEVGVSLDDLRRLGSQDIFKKAVEGLGKIEDVSKRNRVAVELFGKEFRAVNSAATASAFGPAAADSLKFASATKSAADASDKLASTIDTFRQQLLVAIKPINDLINSLDPKKIAAFTQTVIDITQALILLYAATKAASGIRFLIDSFRVLGGTSKATTGLLGEAALGLKQLGQAFNLNSARTVASYTGFSVLGITLKSLAGGFIRLIPLVGTLYAGFQILDGVVEMLTGRNLGGWFDDAASGLENFVSKNLPGLAAQINKLGEAMGMAPSPSAERENQAEIKRMQARAESAKNATEELKRGQEAMAKIGQEYAKNNLASKQELQTIGETLSVKGFQLLQDRMMIGLSEDQIELRRTMGELDDQMFAKQADIARQIEKITLERSFLKKGQEDESKILTGQIQILQKQSKEIETLYGNHKEGLSTQIILLQSARLIEKARLQDIENTTKAIEDQIARQQTLGGILQEFNNQSTNLKFEFDQIGVTGISKDINQALKQVQDRATEAGRQFADSFQQFEDGMPIEAANELAAGLSRIDQQSKKAKDQTVANIVANYEYEQSIQRITDAFNRQQETQQALGNTLRSINDQRVSIGFESGQQGVGPLARQFAEIQESARKAALEAGRAFAATFESEDGLTAERAEELAAGLQSIAEGYRGIAAAQTEVLTNSRTFASGLAETFAAYAESANNAASQAKTYFETFTGGMEDALVKFVQTGKLSFKDLANSLIADLIRIQTRKIITGLFGGGGGGGILGGLFGMSAGGPTDLSPMIVGERGPELFVPGSAGRIVPNNALGGTTMQTLTTVNYNIQAVDASSFRTLLAKDPQFIYAVTEKGRRSQPQRSRV